MSSLLVAGYGFLGANLAIILKEEGLKPCIVARKSSIRARSILEEVFKNLDATIIAFEELGLHEIKDALTRCRPSQIYYLAGAVRGAKRIWNAHTGLWSSLLEALLGFEGIESIIYTSSVASMGEATACIKEGYVVEEEEHLRGCKPRGVYEESKAEGERIGLKYYREYGLPVAIARPVMLYGPYGYHLEWRMIYRLARFGIVLDAPVQTVFSLDAARALHFIASNIRASRGLWYIVAHPEGVSVGDVSRLLVKNMGNRITASLRLPWILGGLIAFFSRDERPRLFARLQGYRYKPARLLEQGFKSWSSLEESIHITLSWMRRAWGD